jgi:hypothetical protein
MARSDRPAAGPTTQLGVQLDRARRRPIMAMRVAQRVDQVGQRWPRSQALEVAAGVVTTAPARRCRGTLIALSRS